MVMVAETSWRELCRFDDPLLAHAVATSIEAMEFDVLLRAAGGPTGAEQAAYHGQPPYVVQVVASDWGDLAEVLQEIIAEQQEFDRMLLQRRVTCRHSRIVTVIALTGAAELLLILALADW
ncbi:MAG: hypothetical protein ACYS0D_00605 [Planctomycetota bacterium]|jgi:hypothetical protein